MKTWSGLLSGILSASLYLCVFACVHRKENVSKELLFPVIEKRQFFFFDEKQNQITLA
jgi:hypothetical protein